MRYGRKRPYSRVVSDSCQIKSTRYFWGSFEARSYPPNVWSHHCCRVGNRRRSEKSYVLCNLYCGIWNLSSAFCILYFVEVVSFSSSRASAQYQKRVWHCRQLQPPRPLRVLQALSFSQRCGRVQSMKSDSLPSHPYSV